MEIIMKNVFLRVATIFMTAALLFAALPIAALADGTDKPSDTAAEDVNSPGYIEVDDGYLKIQVSESNGGFFVGTVEGDKLLKSDNNKFLLYPDESFDTSFTSFRVTKGGKKSEYIFGRDYSYLGLECSDVVVYKNADNAITAEWSVDGLLFKQIIALMGQDTYQHGMAYVSYSVDNLSGEDVESIEARVMMDTALGYQDYAYYMLGQTDGSFVTVDKEKTIDGNGYSNYFFAYDSEVAPTVTAYMLNASVAGETIVPEKVTFAHWNNLAATVFDYQPSSDEPHDFKDQYNLEFMTADSAVALYYSMGEAKAEGSGRGIGLYYGVYSNQRAGDAEVAMNFTNSGNMYLTEDEKAYKDLNGSLPGNFSTTIKLQNIGDETISQLKVAIYPGEELYPYNERGNLITDATINDPYYREIKDLRPLESRDVRLDFQIDPTYVTDYRKIKIVVYNTSNMQGLEEENTVLSEEFYVLCPSSDNAEIGFTGMTPGTIFTSGRRFVYMTGTNFNLLRDKTQYRLVLRPMDGGEDVVLDQDLVVVNPEKNSATLVLNQELRVGTWQLIVDWNDAAVEDIVNDALRLVVSDVPQPGDPGYVSSGTYGIVTIERSGTGKKGDPFHYEIVNYDSESALRNSETEPKNIMLVLRGDFNVMSTEEKGNIKAEALTLMDGDVITISEAIEVKEGRVTVTVEYDDNGNQKTINVDIEGKVRTANSKTKVWDGVLAITSFDEGVKYTLPVYSEQGDLGYFEGEEGGQEITLLWPSAAGAAQTLVGLLFDLRYGEFALMKQGKDYGRVIAFGAKLSPDILVPNGTVANYGLSKKEQAHQNMSNTNYTSMDLRITELYNKEEERKWREKQVGTLNMYVDDILFGGEGFIGFNTAIEVGIPSYAQGMPYIRGTLALKIINDYWEFGVEGEADAIVFEMEASLQLKSHNGIPVPDKVYFFIGGFDPGVLVDPIGCLWIKGAGAGVDRIYETFFRSNVVPPLTLLISGQFAIFQVLEARADLALSFRGIEGYLNNVKVGGAITILDTVGGKLYWYPSFEMAFAIRMNILDAIIGEGSMALKVDYDGDVFFQAYAKVTIQIPRNIFLIGGTKIGEASVGLDTKKVWGAVKVIGIGVGIIYYWGGSVDITTGKKVKVPEPEFGFNSALDAPYYVDPETGEMMYMSVMNGVRFLGSSDPSLEDTVITSSTDRRTHSFTLNGSADEDGLLALSFPARNAMEAEDMKHQFKVKVGDEEYPLEWFNNDYAADDPVNLGTNAMLNYNEETGIASVSVSFTDRMSFDKEIKVTSPVSSDASLYAVERLVDFESLEFVDNENTNDVAILKGADLNKLSKLTVQAVDENGVAYLLRDENMELIIDDTHEMKLVYPRNLPTGNYTLRAIGTVMQDGVEVASPMAETTFSYVNHDQPDPVKSNKIEIGGNYTVEAHVEVENKDFDGYIVNVYESTEDGLKPTIYSDMLYELTDEEKESGETKKMLLTGGRYSGVDPETEEVREYGLEAGKKYVVAVQTYKIMEDESRLYSTVVLSDELLMVEPTVTDPELSIEGAVPLSVGSTTVSVDTVNNSTVTVLVDGVDKILSGSYTLNGGEEVEWDGGDILLEDLEDGAYTLKVSGVNATKDSFAELYQFSVDTKAPDIQISSPQGGGFFEDGKITVTGLTEAGATVRAGVEDGEEIVITADENGEFEVEIPLDSTMAYQNIRVYASDVLGNESMPFGCTLTNASISEEELEAVILLDGKEISELVADEEGKQLTFAFKNGDNYIYLNSDSVAAARVLWKTSVIEGSAEISDSGLLTGSRGAVGIVTATLDNLTAMVRIAPMDISTVKVTLDIPESGYIYDGLPKTPAVTVESDEELILDEDYTISYVGNLHAGQAAVVITATEDGKCTGIKIVDFTIAQRSITEAEITVEKDGSTDPKITVTFGGKTLEEGVDYTVEYKVDTKGRQGIVSVSGKGDFKNVVSKTYEISLGGIIEDIFDGDNGPVEFDHMIWIIPVAFLSLIGAAALTLGIIKKTRRRKKNKATDTEKESRLVAEKQNETVEDQNGADGESEE